MTTASGKFLDLTTITAQHLENLYATYKCKMQERPNNQVRESYSAILAEFDRRYGNQ